MKMIIAQLYIVDVPDQKGAEAAKQLPFTFSQTLQGAPSATLTTLPELLAKNGLTIGDIRQGGLEFLKVTEF